MHPLCKEGIIDGNPLYEDLLEGYYLLPDAIGIQTIINEKGEIGELFVGELRESSSLSRAVLMEQNIVKVDEKSDLVIASCGGMPHDINLVQAH